MSDKAIEAQVEAALEGNEAKAFEKMKSVWQERSSNRGRAPRAIGVLSAAFPRAGECFLQWRKEKERQEAQKALEREALELLK